MSTYYICLSGSGIPYGLFFFLALSIFLEISRYHFYHHMQMYHIFLIHSSVEWHLGCFQVLTITNNAAMNIVEQMFLWYDRAYIEYMLSLEVVS